MIYDYNYINFLKLRKININFAISNFCDLHLYAINEIGYINNFFCYINTF